MTTALEATVKTERQETKMPNTHASVVLKPFWTLYMNGMVVVWLLLYGMAAGSTTNMLSALL
jgi:hypothetical protein